MPVTIKTKKAPRIPSTIAWPYTDMTDAIAVAEGLLKGGGTALSRDQLAAAMGLAPGGGNFNTKVGTARTFGVMDAVGGKYQLTELGFNIADPARQKEAMVDAFLSVELFKKAYDEFRGKRLPPRPQGLEAAFINWGVSPKNARFARHSFDKSARMAGFFPNGDEDRLVMPFGPVERVAISDIPDRTKGGGLAEFETIDEPVRVARVVDEPDIHPSIMGMVRELPAPKGTWTKAEQADWLQAMATMFRVIYKGDDGTTVSVSLIRDPTLGPPPRRPLNLGDE
jgi:hypothetical protein